MSIDELIWESFLTSYLRGTPPPNTPGIGYLTYYADDMCEKNFAFARPVLNGELVHSANILILLYLFSFVHIP